MDHIEIDIKLTVVRSHKGAVRLPPPIRRVFEEEMGERKKREKPKRTLKGVNQHSNQMNNSNSKGNIAVSGL